MQVQIKSWILGRGPSNSFYCVFHVRRVLLLLFAIGNITFGGNGSPALPGSTPVKMNMLFYSLFFLQQMKPAFWR